MPSSEALGRLINAAPAADGVYINVSNAAAIGFLGYLAGAAGDTYTVVEATDSAGTGAQNLVKVSQYYTCAGAGATAWVKNTQAAAATVTTTAVAAQNTCYFTIQESQLSDGYSYVKVTSTGAGLVTALPHDLKVQRTPANLPAVGV